MTDRHSYAGGGVVDTLVAAIGQSDSTISGSALTGWPTGVNPFVIIIGRGTPTEEHVLCASRSGTSLAVASVPVSGRGYDGTAAQAHAAGDSLILGIAAVEMDQLNAHGASTSVDDHTQYLNTARHDTTARHAFGAALATPAAPSISRPGDARSAGAAAGPARADHRHGREVLTATTYAKDTRSNWFGATGSLTLVANIIYLVPFMVYANTTITSLAFNATTAPNTTVFFALYTDGGNTPNGNPISSGSASYGNLAAYYSTGSNGLSSTPPIGVAPGLYWLGMKASSGFTVTAAVAGSEAYDVTSPTPASSSPGLATASTVASGMAFTTVVASNVPLLSLIQ